jgi:plasmid stabilization system protein ParE
MRVTYHPRAQQDVNRILKRYDAVSPRLGDEFWDELTARIKATAENPGRSHPTAHDLRRVNLRRFPYHFLFRVLPDRIRITVVRHHQRHPSVGLGRI